MPAARAIWPPLPGFISTLWTIVPTGIWPSSIALPGFTSIFLPATTLSPDGEALRREDVGELAVLIFDQSDEGGAVGIIFEPLDGRRRCPTCDA